MRSDLHTESIYTPTQIVRARRGRVMAAINLQPVPDGGRSIPTIDWHLEKYLPYRSSQQEAVQ